MSKDRDIPKFMNNISARRICHTTLVLNTPTSIGAISFRYSKRLMLGYHGLDECPHDQNHGDVVNKRETTTLN